MSNDCIACGGETGGAHKYLGCDKFIHAICGRQIGEEGYGRNVSCASCDLSTKNEISATLPLNIKRSQEKCHQRMLNANGKRFKPAEIGDNTIIPISKPDKLSTISPRNILTKLKIFILLVP